MCRRIVLLPETMYFYRTNTNVSLQQTVNKSPFCCIDARAAAKRELSKRGVFEQFENFFINEFYSGIFNQLTRINLTWDMLVEFRRRVRENFDFSYVAAEQVHNKTAYTCVQGLFFDNEAFNVRDLLVMLKDSRRELFFLKAGDELRQLNIEYKKITVENKKLKAEHKELKNKLKKSVNSRSYRLGRALTWLPRKLRGGLRCCKQHGFVYTCGRVKQKLKKVLKQIGRAHV